MTTTLPGASVGLVALWIGAGWLFAADVVGHLLLAIPFVVAFHLGVRRRPLPELWAPDTSTVARSRGGQAGVLAALTLVVVLLILQSASSDRWIDDSWTVLLMAGTLAVGYLMLRRFLVVVTVAAVVVSVAVGASAPRLSTDGSGDPSLLARLTAMQEDGRLAGYQDLTILATAILDGTAPGLDALRAIAPAGRSDTTVGTFWHITRGSDGRTVTWHNGQTGGYTSYMGLDLEHHRAVIVMSDVAKDVMGVGTAILSPAESS